MEDWKEFSGKTKEEAITKAIYELKTSKDNLDIEVVEEEKNGFLGLFNKAAVIKVRRKDSSDISSTNNESQKVYETKTNEEYIEIAKDFLSKTFTAMNLEVDIQLDFNTEEKQIEIELKGNDMGMLIGKRGQTLDSLQYLTSLVVNKHNEDYIKIKIDTENYRQRRKDTIENLAKNVANKVKKTGRPTFLEPMNPYERRIIHAALQNDKFVDTHSEGEEPNRKVVITLNKEFASELPKRNYKNNNGRKNNGYNKNRNRNRNYSGKKNYSNGGYSRGYNDEKIETTETNEAVKVNSED